MSPTNKRVRQTYEFRHYSNSPIPKVKVVTFFSPADALREYLEIYHETANVGTILLTQEAEGVWSYKMGTQESVWVRRKS
jgi:predicted nucleotidyltransferase